MKRVFIALLLLVTPAEAQSPPTFTVTLDKIMHSNRERLGQYAVFLDLKVKNESDRDALLINAKLVFRDLLDNPLGIVIWENNRGIKAGAEAQMRGEFFQDRPGRELEKLTQIDPALVKITFEVFKIAYADGEIVTYKECETYCNF